MDVVQPESDGSGDVTPEKIGRTASYFWHDIAEEDDKSLDAETMIIADRRRVIAKLYAQNLSMREIRDRLIEQNVKVSLMTISRDVAAVHEWYLKAAVRHIAEWKSVALRKLQFLEQETLEQWQRSKGATVKTHSTRRTKPAAGGAAGSPASAAKSFDEAYRVEKYETYGDPRLMALLIQIWDRQAQLFGLVIRTDVGQKLDELPPVKMVAGVNPVELV